MTAPVAGTSPGRRLPGPFVACFLYAARVCVPPKRWAILAIPSALAVVFGLLARLVSDRSAEAAFAITANGIFFLVVPIVCLVLGDAVLGAERRSGAFALTWLSPTPIPTIVLARWAAGWALSSITLAPAVALAAVVAGAAGGIPALLVAVVAGSAAYVAVFVVVGAVFQRAALWSLALVFLVERLLGTVLAGIAQISPMWLTRSTYGALGPDADDLVRTGVPSGWGAVVRLAIVTALALLLADRRVRKLQLDADGGD